MILYKDNSNKAGEILLQVDSLIVPRIGEHVIIPIDNIRKVFLIKNIFYEFKYKKMSNIYQEDTIHIYMTFDKEL